MLIKEQPYRINKQVKLDVTTTESNLDINGQAVYIHNTGNSTVYMDTVTGVTADDWEIRSGFIIGPITASAKLYFKCDANSTLKFLFLEV